MTISIHPLKLGITTCYLIQGESAILIDSSDPYQVKPFQKALAGIPVNPGDISLILLTHGHFDHTGSARDIQALTGAKLALHRADQALVESAKMVFPKAVTTWGAIMGILFRPILPVLFRYSPTPIDLVIGDEGLPLGDYGIPGRVIHTPGHTDGSMSVLLDTGEAFVGCMAHNGFPFRLSPGLPILADDIETLKKSWNMLLDLNVHTIYPAHGKPFPAEVMRIALA